MYVDSQYVDVSKYPCELKLLKFVLGSTSSPSAATHDRTLSGGAPVNDNSSQPAPRR